MGNNIPPVGQSRNETRRRRQVASELRSMARDAGALAQALASDPHMDADLQWEFPDPYSSEMLTRWDMQSHPPDILITNTVMLNVVLMRDLEDHIFESTRQWLRADPAHALTLVVDELHGYSGTQGTEVALVLRKLRARLGLQYDSPQLRCIGASASLDASDDELADFGEKFFGIPSDTFVVLRGSLRPLESGRHLSRDEYAGLAKGVGGDNSGEALERLSDRSTRDNVPRAVEWACRGPRDRTDTGNSHLFHCNSAVRRRGVGRPVGQPSYGCRPDRSDTPDTGTRYD